MSVRRKFVAYFTALLAGCIGPLYTPIASSLPFDVTVVAEFEEPWAMSFLPGGGMLITDKRGALELLRSDGTVVGVKGMPEVRYGGQGGMGDIVLHPDFVTNQLVYFSFVEGGPRDTRGAVVARGRIELYKVDPIVTNVQVIWRQIPKMSGTAHYGYRIAFGPNGYLWISSGERNNFDPAQDMESNLGKIIRLHDDGWVPVDNPFADLGGIAAQVWSLGHRNPLGIAFDGNGRLWNVEMGPRGGDELNLVIRGANYGYPIVSEGDHYDGRPIPDHAAHPEFEAPVISWTPVIAPSSLIFYDGDEFPAWRGDAFVTGLASQVIARIEIDGDTAREAERFDMGKRIRAVKQGPDGALWVLEDGRGDAIGRLLRLSAPND